MGGGGALAAGPEEAPRLTSVLRALGGRGLDDLSQLAIARRQALQAKDNAHAAEAKKGGTLAQVLFGELEKAPKPARTTYDGFLRAVMRLINTDASSAELAEAALRAWRALEPLGPPETARGRGPTQLVITPHKEALSAALGPGLDMSAALDVVTHCMTLRDQCGLSSQSSHSAAAAAAALGKPSQPVDPSAGSRSTATRSSLEAQEWGSDLAWAPVSLEPDAVQHALAGSGLLGPTPGGAGAGGAVQHGGGTSNTGRGMPGMEPSPQELRSLAARGYSPQQSSPQQQQAAAGVGGFGGSSGYDDHDEDLGEEYEEGKRLRQVNLHWLQRWTERVLHTTGPEVYGMAESVATVLLLSAAGGPGASETVAAQLLELLGPEAAEHISDLIEQRRLVLGALQLAIAKLRAEEDDEGKEAAMPVYGSQVTINSSSQKLMAKIARKEAKRGGKGGAGKQGGDADVELLQALGWEALLDTERDYSATLTLGNGLEFKIGGDGALGGARKALPAGTTRKTYKGYEEVYVPAPTRAPPPADGEMVAISQLDDWAQLAFEGYRSLNRIQSRIFKTAYYSNENMLVCAPTGAGKTNIAMISVLREVGQNMRHGVIQKADFKVVYVAPMKALAAEVTANFSRRLQPLGLVVRELTGDMQLSKKELAETNMIVTTPEKWDVITRKGGDVSVASLVRLLIIDEVHLLNDDRGPVIETLVARTQRQVEASQAMIRIVGLSATLPNYEDVATFLNVNLQTGLFHFDASFRPVPLETWFVGVSVDNFAARNSLMTEICYNKVVDSLKRGHQVMVFVHSRKDTGKTARSLSDLAVRNGDTALFDTREHPKYTLHQKDVRKSRNRELGELFEHGFGMHHAGMLRPDRSLTERMFSDGVIKVLVCTATLAWGVNLPAHTVIIKGTQVYDAQKGTFTELGMLDVQQIFGRAGRPQFDTSGEATIITTHNKLAHYLGMLTHQVPIESQFKSMLADNLNAEIVLGSVTNVREALAWLSYTYLNTRLPRNPLAYGLTFPDVVADPSLETYKRNMIIEAAKTLKGAQMAVFDEKSGNLYVSELGRVASHFYIRHASITTFNSLLTPHMTEPQVLAMIAQSSEFEGMMVREEELPELEKLSREACPHDVKGGIENKHGKANILMQAFVSRARVESFSLTADMMYVSQNAPRILRAVFEIALRRKWSTLALTALRLCQCMEKRLWENAHPLRQFDTLLSPELLMKLEERGASLEMLADMSASEIGAFVRHPAAGAQIKGCVDSFPSLSLEAALHPITRTVLRIELNIKPTFEWRDRSHGAVLRWLIMVTDSSNEHIYHSENWLLTRKMAKEGTQKLAFTIPIFEPLPPQYYVHAICDDWMHAEYTLTLSFHGLVLPERMPPHTELLDLDPLPLSALNNPAYEAMYTGRFTHFNPIQTQAFHTLYHTDESVLLGAPTGSGKTISSELTMLRVFSTQPDRKIIYIAPLKALVRERIEDWGKGLCAKLGKKMVELTGDYTPDLRALLAADIIICTPEKWDGISRAWQSRSYVKKVALVVIDEIHLLGADRGPILEVIVSRMRYIATQTGRPVRFVGLSTALANAQDLADWLGIGPAGLFNFKPSVRPVPLEAHIQGYPGKFYCPRMASMNKPCYAAIQMHSPTKPVLVFVSSRRQTRLTALDLITYAVGDMRPSQWVHMPEDELEEVLGGVRDAALKHTLQFGIGLHHAGLNDRDRTLVERLFVEQKIQILVATSTLAWGVNTPAHLVVIKGTEFYDAPTRRYVDFPITDVLQMMGRAGRPQYDRHGVAVIMVHEPKKQFYKRFLYEPFPVESSLPGVLPDHLNAEVVAGTIKSRQDALDYLTWTYFFRRLVQNPSYYDLSDTSAEGLSEFLSGMVETALEELQEAGCIEVGGEDEGEEDVIAPTTTGRVASFYYLQHTTMTVFTRDLQPDMGVPELLQVLCSVPEYDELPVRHNEDKLNAAMARGVRYPVDIRTADDPHTKAHLLLQAHLSRSPLPISDYVTDTKGVLDNSLRILQAMVDVAADGGWLGTALSAVHLIQCIMQARWVDEPSLLALPHLDESCLQALQQVANITVLPQLMELVQSSTGAGGGSAGGSKGGQAGLGAVSDALAQMLGAAKARDVLAVCERLPRIAVRASVQRVGGSSSKAGALQDDSHLDDEDDHGGSAGADGSDQGWVLEVELSRLRPGTGNTTGSTRGGGSRGGGRPRVYAPRFPKVKEEGWFLIAGDPDTHELLALKRLSVEDRTVARLAVPARNGTGRAMRSVTVYFMSDSYLGLDQQYKVPLGAGSGKQGAAVTSAQHDGGAEEEDEFEDAQEEYGGGGQYDSYEEQHSLVQPEEEGTAAAGAGEARRQRRAAARAQRAQHAPVLDPEALGISGLQDDEPGCA